MQFDKEIATKLKIKYDSNKSKYQNMYDYWRGKTLIDILYKEIENRSNRKAHVPYIRKFISEHVAYGLNAPITYTSASDNTECIKDIEYNVAIQKGSLDSELYKNMLIFGESYEIAYIYKDELRFRVVNPLNACVYCNTEDEAEMLLYFYTKELDDTKTVYIDCYCDEAIYHFDNSFNTVAEPTPLYFGCVPVSVARLQGGKEETLYNDISNLCDNYEAALSDMINNSGDLRDCYMKAKGMSIDDTVAEKIKEEKLLIVPAEGDVDFLIKNLPSDYMKTLLGILEDKIYQISQSVNMNEAMQSNTSSVAILSRIINLRNRIKLEQKCLGDAISNRLKLLFTYLNIAYSKNYNYRDIAINFTISVPQDDVSTANMISQLTGKLSIETGLNQLSFIQNGRKEFEKMLAEQKEIAKNSEDGITDLDKVGGTDEAN
ncbi:phage portal protein [Inconstantimicrobium mannanitabidum]|uniref:Uncharacterized protein n=1 Tax=Inconstantimicrobium mannanitabidum TaxID=1604901 RepID=A0ACB5R9F6_9CLOT|nr:phage portal protein [Clostridium sp. TW13]GKX65828.1 hypothetical protein rsdtw13_10860 [Clostridium sp. TW13]